MTVHFTLLSSPHSSHHPSSSYPNPVAPLPPPPQPPTSPTHKGKVLSWPIPPLQAQLRPELTSPELTLPTQQASLVLHSLIRPHLFPGASPGSSMFKVLSLTLDIPRHFASSLVIAQILVYLVEPKKLSEEKLSNWCEHWFPYIHLGTKEPTLLFFQDPSLSLHTYMHICAQTHTHTHRIYISDPLRNIELGLLKRGHGFECWEGREKPPTWGEWSFLWDWC